VLREAAGIARIGGDEFVVVLGNIKAEEARALFEKLIAAIASLGLVRGREVGVSASVGVAETDGAATGGQLMQRADMAMYRAKGREKGSIWVYSVDDEAWEHRRKEELSLVQADFQRASQEARTDALTGLPNARAYHEYLVAVDSRECEGPAGYAVLFFDATTSMSSTGNAVTQQATRCSGSWRGFSPGRVAPATSCSERAERSSWRCFPPAPMGMLAKWPSAPAEPSKPLRFRAASQAR
jgi:GGDEF domain-containing protein